MAALCDLWDPGWGIPGFRIELYCFFHLLYGPFASFPGHTYDDTQDVIVHLISQSW